MIKNLAVGNFKAIRAVNLPLGPLNVFAGPNGAGKSSLVEALRFLHEAVVGDPSRALARWRGIVSMRHLGAAANDPISWRIAVRERDAGALAEYTLELGPDENGVDLLVRKERLDRKLTEGAGTKRKLFELAHGRGTVQDDVTKRSFRARFSPKRLALHSLADEARHAHVVPFANDIASWRFVNPVPSWMRPPTPLGTDAVWHETGIAVALQLARADKQELAAVSERLSSLLAGPAHLKPIISSEGGLIQLKEDALSGLLPSWTLSDGTLRLLAILTALHIGPSPAVLCVEEPESAVHPGAIDALMEEFRAAAEAGTQILLTTHSPYLLNRVPRDIGSLIWVKRPKGEAIFAHVEDNARLKKEMERFGFGTLLEQGILGRAM